MFATIRANLTEGAEGRRLTTLYELLAALTRAKAMEDVYQAAIDSLLAATAAERAAILTFDQDGIMRFNAWRDLSLEYREAADGYAPWPEGAQNAEPVVIPDVLIEENFRAYRDIFAREKIRAVAFIPLSPETGVLGKFALYYTDPHECTQDELAIAQVIASHVALVIERKRAEIAPDRTVREQLEAASLHLSAIVESSDDAIVSKDLNGIITSWNRSAERVFGYTAAEVIGKPVSILAAPERLDEMPNILNQIRQGQRVDHYETLRRRKDGQIIQVSLTVSPVRDASGRVIGASKIARDITDRKRVESERALLLSREQEARKTAELLNRVSPMLAAELELRKLVQSVTDLATELVGAEFGSFFHNVVNEQGESYVLYTLSGALREAFAGFPMPRNTEIFGPTFRGEGVVRCEDVTGDPRYGRNAPYYGMPKGHLPVRSYLAAPVVSRSGEVLGGLFFGHSMPGKFTEQHEAILTGVAAQAAIAMDNARLLEQAQWVQNELKRSNEELRRANQDLETFAYSASHDLQEPLRTVALAAQLLERRYIGQLQGDAQQFLSTIVQGVQRMENLIRDILAYATATKHAEGLPPSVDSGRVLAAVLENLKGLTEQAGATVSSGDLPVVSVHENRLAQLFQNLIGNALKYRGKEAPRVHISAIERDGWSVFSVVDNGIGIERKFADLIFGLFKRLHNRAEYPGSGIGLAICQRIVEQYGGRIWLEHSIPGEGSTFCFTFPSRTG
ncbi:MAG TPA: PAS domain S-box protein [Bryobacteraceae bacterium]|nr:PAS domain S-box protein [Bryobacteraceae bacterium]